MKKFHDTEMHRVHVIEKICEQKLDVISLNLHEHLQSSL